MDRLDDRTLNVHRIEFGAGECLHFDLQIETVEHRPRDACGVLGNLDRCATAAAAASSGRSERQPNLQRLQRANSTTRRSPVCLQVQTSNGCALA